MTNDTRTVTLTEFLLARIAEDEAAATVEIPRFGQRPEDIERVPGDPRLLAECEAKRRIVEHCEPDLIALSPGDEYVLQLLAAVYADHPDYRDEWRP